MTVGIYALDPTVFESLQARIDATDLVVPDAAFMQTNTGRVARGEHMRVAGNVALVPVTGVLEKKPSLFSMFFGGFTAYGDIVQAITDANADTNVEMVSLEIDSPGGNTDGIQSVVDAIRNSGKPVVANVTDNAHSAAYWIATQASKIFVNNEAAQVGNIGVMTQRSVNDKIVTLTSTKAPEKFPDAGTEEGRSKIVARLDELHQRFAQAVATGRNVTVATVNSEFGQGRSVLADAAVAAGMIDGIGSQETSPAATDKAERKESVMDLQTLKADHPEVYKAAKAEGFEDGQAAEKDRTNALLTYGTQCNAMDIAIEAIANGDNPATSQTLIAKFMTAGRNNTDLQARENDNPEDVNAGGEEEEVASVPFGDFLDIDATLKEMES